MLGNQNKSNRAVGTTAPIFISRSADVKYIEPGDYFWVKIHGAQAVFRGSVFDNVKQLVITSKVNLNHPKLGSEDFRSIQRTTAVQKNVAQTLGLSQNLVSLVPVTMTHLSLSIAFILDTESNLAKMGKLFNDDSFLAVVSLAPGAVAVAKVVGGLGQKIIESFIPSAQQKPILEFSGDFNFAAGGGGNALRDGYYIILGSCDESNPLPPDTSNLELRGAEVFLDGQKADKYSYVILDIQRVEARTRKLSEGAAWDKTLGSAEHRASEIAKDDFADEAQLKTVIAECKVLLENAHELLLGDISFTPEEAEAIYQTAANRVRQDLRIARQRLEDEESSSGAKAGPLDYEEENLPWINPGDDLDAATAAYAARVTAATVLLENRPLN